MSTGDQVAVPAQHGLRTDQQPDTPKHVTWQPLQRRVEPRPINPSEPDLLAAELPFGNRDLMPEREDLSVFVPGTHRQQPEQGERVGHAEVGQSNSTAGRPCAVVGVDRRCIEGSPARHYGGSQSL